MSIASPIISGQEVRGELDFETYSEAGYIWDAEAGKWRGPPGAGAGKRSKGLGAVGTRVYAEHPTTEVLTASYRLPLIWWNPRTATTCVGGVTKRWRPGKPLPQELFDFLAGGGLLECHKLMFERSIWELCCAPKYGWPSLEPFVYQLRCSMAKARVNGLPGALGNLSKVLALPIPKDARGGQLLDKFSVPRNPTASDARRRVTPPQGPPCPPPPAADLGRDAQKAYRAAVKAYERDLADWTDFQALESYCDTDIDAEQGASDRMYPLSEAERLFWWIDQEINWRGIAVDRPALRDCVAVLQQVLEQYGHEYRQITGGLNPTQLDATKAWLAARGVPMLVMDEDAIAQALKRPNLLPHPPGGTNPARRVLEIRQLTGSASVKKLFAMENQCGSDDRLHDLIVHHGARTGRPTGEGPQPLNLPRAGPDLLWCDQGACSRPFRKDAAFCPWCFAPANPAWKSKWSEPPACWPEGKPFPSAVDYALEVMAHRNLDLVELHFGNALLTISGCLRGLFVGGPGREFMASDYSAIEAVVIAVLAGEDWRVKAFENNEPIYLLGASKITGKSVDWYLQYKADHKSHHEDRQYIGKVSELALGFGGWINAWRAMEEQQGIEESPFTDDQIKNFILSWRKESPAIVEMWGGQFRGRHWERDHRQEYFGVEGAAVQAIQYPGRVFDFRGIAFYVRDGHLIIRLPSTRELIYRNATLEPSTRKGAAPGELSIMYWTWNTNAKYGPLNQWVPMNTFGGRLTENIVQAVAHDILRHAVVQLRAAGYPTVLHVYDEIVAEIPIGAGSLEQFELIMNTMPAWAAGWPVAASGGWRGWRYRKG